MKSLPPSFKQVEIQDLIQLIAESILLSFSDTDVQHKRKQQVQDVHVPASIIPSDIKTVKAHATEEPNQGLDHDAAPLSDSSSTPMIEAEVETETETEAETRTDTGQCAKALSPSSLSRFHSQSPPQISVLLYLQRIFKYTNTEASLFLLLLLYGERLSQITHGKFKLNALTVHRFLISCVTVATKMHCDTYFTNTIYAKIGGISVQELNLLELDLLYLMDWKLHMEDDHEIQGMYARLVNNHPKFQFLLSQE